MIKPGHDYRVLVGTDGNLECPVDSASETEISCTLSAQTPAGDYALSVYFDDRGQAARGAGMPATDVTKALKVGNFTPDLGSVSGGNFITIQGEGFPKSQGESLKFSKILLCRTKKEPIKSTLPFLLKMVGQTRGSKKTTSDYYFN